MTYKLNPITGKLDFYLKSHLKLSDIGTRTHAQIDTKLDGIEDGATADQTKADIDGLGLSHDSLVDVSANDHHNELHSIASHNDTSATGIQLNTLTDNSIADALHRHSELVASDGSPDPAVSVDASGNVGLGTSTPDGHFHIATSQDTPFIIRRDGGKIRQEVFCYSDAVGDEPQFNFGHIRGTEASPTATQVDDELGTINFVGFTDAVKTSASIRGYADTGYGAAGADSPGRLVFLTTPDGSATLAVRMTIKSDGHIGVGTPTPATSALMDLTSTTGALLLTRMTTAQKNALTAVNGMILYDSTLNKIQGYQAGSWQNLI